MNKLLKPEEAAKLMAETINECTKELSPEDRAAVLDGLSAWFFGETKVD
jgi:hypothetical protein